jgi:hypothetical protein
VVQDHLQFLTTEAAVEMVLQAQSVETQLQEPVAVAELVGQVAAAVDPAVVEMEQTMLDQAVIVVLLTLAVAAVETGTLVVDQVVLVL